MKVYNLLLLLVLLGCKNAEESKVIEQDVFIVSLKRDFDDTGLLILKDRSKTIHSSKDFWNYFIKTRPISSSLIFAPDFDGQKSNYLHLGDTLLAFYNGSIMSWVKRKTVFC